MDLWTVDFESYFSQDYSLSKAGFNTERYCRDSRFRAHGLGVRDPSGASYWVTHDDLPAFFAGVDWANAMVLAHHCVPGDSEILTPGGWVRLRDFSGGQAMQFEPRTGALTFCHAARVKVPYKGDMLAWNLNYHRGQYTPKHRMLYCTAARKDYRIDTVENVNKRHPNNAYIPISGYFAPSPTIALTVIEARLLEAIRADGSWLFSSGNNYGVRFKFAKKRKVARLEAIFALCGINARKKIDKEGYYTLFISSTALVEKIYALLGKNKVYGAWVLDLSLESRQAIVEETAYWDGSQRKFSKRGWVFSTADDQTAYWLEVVAHVSGYAFHGEWRRNDRGKSAYLPECRLFVANISRRDKTKLGVSATAVPFNGDVYCLTVPTGAFLVRMNGRVVVTGNCQFDGLILAHHYGVHPGLSLCTKAIGNAVVPREAKSLDALAKFYGLPPKYVPYNLFKGIRVLPPEIERQVADGCLHDVHLNFEIFKRFMQGDKPRELPPFPVSQLPIVSAYVEMFTRASLAIDLPRIDAFAARMETIQEEVLDEVGVERDVLASREYFADLLRELGVAPPVKASPSDKSKTTYAFGKTDAGMRALLEHENPIVVDLAAARLGVASTINRTRALRYAATARRGQPIPVYLNYGATFSTRASGGDGMNWANLQRLPNKVDLPDGGEDYERDKRGDIKKGELRLCVTAPEGYRLVIADLSQIEARTLALHAGQMDLIEDFRNKVDVYSRFIQPYFPGLEVSKKTPSERGIGKQLILSNGYQSGAKTTRATAALGSYGPPVHMTLEEAQGLVDYYRGKMHRICDKHTGHWAVAGRMIDVLANRGGPVEWGPVKVHNGRVWLPDGTWLDYTEMRRMEVERPWGRQQVWANRTRKGWDYLYPGKVTAHVNSALARVVMTDALRTIREAFKRWPDCRVALTVYDEIVAVVPRAAAEEARDFMVNVMGRTPVWMPGLPVEVEAEISDRYTK